MSVGPTALEKMLLAHRCALAGTAVTPWGEIWGVKCDSMGAASEGENNDGSNAINDS